jgi:hypothetical protein
MAPGKMLAFLGLLLLLPLSLTHGADAEEEGQALAREIRVARPQGKVDVRGFIRMRGADGRRTSVPFEYRTAERGALWEAVYETPGGEGVPAQRLVVTFSEVRSPVYVLEEMGATNGVVGTRQLLGDAAMIPFAGSDFWLADLGLEYLHWPEHRIVKETRIRMRKGRPCRLLESRNPEAGAAAYQRVLSWIDRETGKPILAEAYGSDGKLMKEFEIGGVTRVNGVWELKNLEMRNVSTDTVTVLEFKYEQREAGSDAQ